MKTIPQVPTLDFLKNASRIYKDPLPFHRECFKKYGDTFIIAPKPGLKLHFTCNQEVTKHILQKNQKNYHKSPFQTEDLGKYIGHGLLTSNGDPWRANRKLIQPAFYKKSIEKLLVTMDEVIVNELQKIPIAKPFNVFELFNDLAFKVVARSLFDLQDVPHLDQQIARLQFITEQAQKTLIKELRLPFLKWYFEQQWLAGKNSIPQALKRIDEARAIIKEIINARRDSHRNTGDLLDMLLHSTYEDGSSMSDQQLIDEILVLFIAGHETTANALSFTVQLLSQHATALDKAIEQARQPLQGDLMTQLMQLPYIKQCIEESLRLYPPAYVVDRMCLQHDSCGDMIIEKDSTWLISFYELHRRPDLWDQPDAFIPERFTPDKARMYRDSYFPFGAGPRMCVGNNFAMFEMILVIKRLLEQYNIKPQTTSVEYHPLISLRPKNALVRFDPV